MELEELEEEEEELDLAVLRALCLLLSVMQGEGKASVLCSGLGQGQTCTW